MTKAAEVERILHRYLIEVVERYNLCPWARPARLGAELAIGVLWGTPPLDAWVAEARALLGRPGARVAMVVAPELEGPTSVLRAIRDHVAKHVRDAGIAEFHPEASLDLATPGRLVPFLRRSPDPLLQLVPFALLDPIRTPPMPVFDVVLQAQLLRGQLRRRPWTSATGSRTRTTPPCWSTATRSSPRSMRSPRIARRPTRASRSVVHAADRDDHVGPRERRDLRRAEPVHAGRRDHVADR